MISAVPASDASDLTKLMLKTSEFAASTIAPDSFIFFVSLRFDAADMSHRFVWKTAAQLICLNSEGRGIFTQ
jgi:hypothetical protein